ncbi:DeoR/GlpR family DNA-binding transcription regulator [Psychroflexus montanilacus]|uniref:DeoR/GlpR family DNA-binding transcription regulator n=1 Tax=Psychroflexus montanilacus TaxID=2873598 RepID=UPI001CCB8AEB|nr:DeoR/GlpR family DNA-binding transcription regulator [Psychroflexus montanilacus]MBZ9652747.1 DeoR/GlpR family DNA-binding transcription regulator [Psychroflexus montanilacus]
MKRHQAILELLENESYVSVSYLCDLFKVSAVTIRKDLKLLEEKGLLFRTHGGATTQNPYINDRHVSEKEKLNVTEKEAIAEVAVKLIKPNDSIMIASGTTMHALAKALNIEEQLNITTSSLMVSLELTKSPNYHILQLGGSIRHSSSSVTGHYSQTLLQNISCNLLFLGVDGIDVDHGCTTTSLEEAILNKEMINSAQKVIVLADSSKFNRKGFGKICELSDIHHIITDSGITETMAKEIEAMGIQLTLV